MHLYQHAAVNPLFCYRVAFFVFNYISIFIGVHLFHAVGRERPEEIILVFQHNRISAGDGHGRRSQNAFVLLDNRTVFRCEKDGAAALINRKRAFGHRIRIAGNRVAGFHRTVQRDAFLAGNGNRLAILSCLDKRAFIDMRNFFRTDCNIAGLCNHFAVDLCIGSGRDRDITRICINTGVFIIDPDLRSRRYGNIAVFGYNRTIHDHVFFRTQFYVAGSPRAAVDSLVTSIRKPDSARFQIAFAVRHKVAGQFNQP